MCQSDNKIIFKSYLWKDVAFYRIPTVFIACVIRIKYMLRFEKNEKKERKLATKLSTGPQTNRYQCNTLMRSVDITHS